jgi:ABC-2 type transport system permease protein
MDRVEPQRFGEVYDRGYQHYLGKRLGRRHAYWALITYSMKRAMGIKKSWTAKVIPFLLYLAVAGTVLIVIGIEAFLPDQMTEEVMDFPDYFGFIYLIEGAFVATIAPEMLCGDRRENVLTLYFSRVLTRLDYVVGKLLATAILTTTISVVPAALLWLFRQLIADAPLTALRENVDDLGRVLLAGTAIALYLGTFGLVVASFTGRKSIAVAVIFIGYAVVEGLVNGVREALDFNRTADLLGFLSPALVTSTFVGKLFNPDAPGEYPWTAYLLAMAVTVALGVLVMLWRYLPED